MPTHLSVSVPILTPLVNENPRYLKNWSIFILHFFLKTMSMSSWFSCHYTFSCRLPHIIVHWSSCCSFKSARKIRDLMLGAPSGSWLCLEILTVTVMKRACDEGQPISRYPILPKHLQQPKIYSWMTSSSPKTHKEWFLSHEPSCILQRIEIKCFRTSTKTIILFLNLRLA